MTTAGSAPRIDVLNRAAPVTLAADELRRVLALLARGGGGPREGGGLRLGTFADFGTGYRPWPAVRQAELDDAIFIETDGAAGIIAGSNPRSVLLATYRFLTELGCRWVRPGADGESIPTVDLAASVVRVAEAAAYRHRGICIEGAVSYEHVRDLIEWMPKVGLNSYFMQFREGYTFFERWYAHRGNPLWPPEPFSIEDARALKARLSGEIGRRGLVFHDVGHGWTCEALGIPGLGWEYAPPAVPPGAERFLAEVDGRRALWGGIPINTQLCFSNREARDLVVADIVAHARAHPEVDVLHVWLGDGTNNHCECAACEGAVPADWYLRLLNEIDARLAGAALPARIVFLVYVDLLWPPVTERLRNPERFILMFAPITRTYSAAYATTASAPVGPLPPYARNRLVFPEAVGENVAFLRAWQELFEGDSFDYDYHLMWDHYRDPGGVASAAVLWQDIRGLAALGLNGLISCQVQRAFFPTGLGMAVLGRALWDRTIDFGAIVEDYFRAAFGADGPDCFAYLQELSRLFDPPYLREEKSRRDPAAAAAYARLPETVAPFRPTIRRNLGAGNRCHARSWHYLDRHADLCLHLAGALRARARGDDEAARRAWERTAHFVREHEADLHPALDVYEFLYVLGKLFADPE
ncbi:MAG: DUF4838 domain-containing protein [Chloroflexota bacterium]|nr:DUF4838 domain-containing protein [Chloroflexota bacterium]